MRAARQRASSHRVWNADSFCDLRAVRRQIASSVTFSDVNAREIRSRSLGTSVAGVAGMVTEVLSATSILLLEAVFVVRLLVRSPARRDRRLADDAERLARARR